MPQLVLEADGYQPYLLSPEKGLRALVRKALELAKDPSKACVDEVIFCYYLLFVGAWLLYATVEFLSIVRVFVDHGAEKSEARLALVVKDVASIMDSLLTTKLHDQVHRILVDIVSAAANGTSGLARYPPLKREVCITASALFLRMVCL